MKIPFWIMPGAWGLRGPQFAEAEARYYLTGEALERRLVEIHYDKDTPEFAKQMLGVDRRFGLCTPYEAALKVAEIEGKTADARYMLALELRHEKIEAYEHDKALAKLDYPEEGVQQELALLEVDRAHGKIGQKDYDKAGATLREEPYITIINDGFDLNQGINGVFFEFDWNVYWIDYLRMHGYGGNSEEEIVEQWFQDVCRSTVAESTEHDPDDAFVMERMQNRIDRGGGKADYL